jgi:NTP pyrophosphatase (non-canonical NTP hydrolase)
MLLDRYQQEALSFAIYPPYHELTYTALGLTSEAGEVADKVKKWLRGDRNTLDVVGLQKELGDCLWYIAVLAHELNLDLSDVAKGNLEKLRKRGKEGTIKGSGDDR